MAVAPWHGENFFRRFFSRLKRRKKTSIFIISLGLKQSRYLNAFDTPPNMCPRCGDDLRMLWKAVPREAFGMKDVRIGYVCLLCRFSFRTPFDEGSPLT